MKLGAGTPGRRWAYLALATLCAPALLGAEFSETAWFLAMAETAIAGVVILRRKGYVMKREKNT